MVPLHLLSRSNANPTNSGIVSSNLEYLFQISKGYKRRTALHFTRSLKDSLVSKS